MQVITLRKTHKLIQKITDKIYELEHEENTIAFNVFESLSTGELTDILERRSNEATKRFEDIKILLSVKAGLRRAVQIKNESSGINTLIGRRQATKELLGLHVNFLQDGETADKSARNPAVIQKRKDAAHAVASNTSHMYMGRDDSSLITVSSIPSNFLYELKARIRTIKEDLEEIEESLMALNTSAGIEVVDIELLRDWELIS